MPTLISAPGQFDGISGTVHDATGSVVPNAKVAISSESRGLVPLTATNGARELSAYPGLARGSGYKVEIEAAGFAPYATTDIDLEVGQNLNLTIPLALGSTSTSVEITGAAELLEDTKTDVSNVVNTRDIMNLPINGRRVDSFVLNTAALTNSQRTFGLLTFRGVSQQQLLPARRQ